MNPTDDERPLEDKAITSARRQGFFLAIAGLAGGGFFVGAIVSSPPMLTGYWAIDTATVLFTTACGIGGAAAFSAALCQHERK